MIKKILLFVLVIGIAASGIVAIQRIKVESRNKVDIVVDYDEAAQLAAASGKSIIEVLNTLKANGVTSVAVSEETFGDLMNSGILSKSFGSGFADGHAYYLKNHYPFYTTVMSIPAWYGEYKTNLDLYLNFILPEAYYKNIQENNNYILISNIIPMSYLETLPVGLSVDAVKEINTVGLSLVARVPNFVGANSKSIDFIIKDVRKQGAKTIIFSGDQALGFKGNEKKTGALLASNGLNFGRVEFSKQKGDTKVAAESENNLVTVHSISQAEMMNMDESSIIERFQRGVKERGVRMCYVRMYYSASDDLLAANANYISKIAKGITKAGYVIAPSYPIEEVPANILLRILAGMGIGAGAVLLLLSIIELGVGSSVIISLITILACAGLAAFGETGRKLVALLSAIVFPTLAIILISQKKDYTNKNVIMQTIQRFIYALVITACGGLLIVGLLSQRSFMLRIDTFMGVKLATLLPVLILTALFLADAAWKTQSWASLKTQAMEKYRSIMNNPILIGQAIGMVVILAVIGLVVARSGNDSGLEVSSTELRFRAILDRIMYVRPRTKEFMLGYPALIAGIYFLLLKKKNIASVLMVIGSIGLISAVNTFCHIHTPLILSLLRVINGAVVGLICGLIVIWIIKRFYKCQSE